MGDPITVPAAPGNLNNVVVPMSTFTEVKTHHVTFVDDHKLLKHDTWDWKNDGEVFPKPEFVYGQKSAPASYTKGTYLTVMVEFEVSPPDAPVLMCTIKGSATWGAMTFEARYALKGGRYAGVFTSAQPLPDKITQLTGDINWTIDNG